ncbi:hypothetical protein ACRAWG_00525 [Methylobacterium sp. P31]
MTEMHNTRFHVLDAMAAVEREISHRLGFGPSRSLTMTEEETMQACAEAAVEAWQDAKRTQPDLEPRDALEQLCAEFIRLHDAEIAARVMAP